MGAWLFAAHVPGRENAGEDLFLHPDNRGSYIREKHMHAKTSTSSFFLFLTAKRASKTKKLIQKLTQTL